MTTLMSLAFLIAAVVAAYFLWVRPVLRSRPELVELHAQTHSWWQAVRERFAGIKAKLLAAGGMTAAAIVWLHDFLLPAITGIDWTPLRALLPDWAWPLILFGVFALIRWLRTLTDRRAAEG
jgi:hypothetical protein